MQTLFTIEDRETGGIKTLIHVSNETKLGLAVIIYTSDEYGTHKSTRKRLFVDTSDIEYHTTLRENVRKEGGIVHTRVSDTPLQKSTQKVSAYPGRDSKGRFIKKK